MGFQALEAFGSVGAFSNPWITFSWARAVGVSAKAAEPRPSACRKVRRVRELGEGCFSDAAPGSEPGSLSVFMASSMANWEGASRLNRKAELEGWGASHQGGTDLRSASEGILWMPIRYSERNRRFRH